MPTVPTAPLRIAVWIGVAGFVLSVAVHGATFTRTGPPDGAMALHVGVFVAFLPPLLALMGWARDRGLDSPTVAAQWALQKELFGQSSTAEKLAVLGAFLYAMVNFTVGFYGATGDPDTVRLFSGHWIAFYLISAVMARCALRLRQDDALGLA